MVEIILRGGWIWIVLGQAYLAFLQFFQAFLGYHAMNFILGKNIYNPKI